MAVVATTGAVIANAVVAVDAPDGPAQPAVNGSARFTDLVAGRHVLVVTAPGYFPGRKTVTVTGGVTQEVAVALLDAVPPLDELTVTASRYALGNEIQPSRSYFSRDEIEGLSELGDDALRVAHRIPGVASSEFSSRSHVRGGALDETAVFLDGVELIEPAHLRDYQSVFSAVDERIVEGIEIYSGGFPVAYGGALSGLMVIDRLKPTERLHHELGLSFLYTTGISSGTFGDAKGEWLVSAREGNLDRLVNDALGAPAYRDTFAHVGVQLSADHRVELSAIAFDDDITVTPAEEPARAERGTSDTGSEQSWLAWTADWSAELSSRTVLRWTQFASERRGSVNDGALANGVVSDRRTLHSGGVDQTWQWEPSDRQWLTFGFATVKLDSGYDYSSAGQLRGVLGTLRPAALLARTERLAPEGSSYSVYVSDRVRLTERLIADFGLRWDKQTYLPPEDDEQYSPRSNFLYRLGSRTDLRMSFGRFFQAERIIDLQVEDGIVDFAPAQSSSHSIVGLEHRFPRDLTLRFEAFRKWTRSARPRYENLFDGRVLLPELRPDRVRVAPDRAEARGTEVLLSGARPVDWWASYSWSDVNDVIDNVAIARGWDQRHAASAGLSWPVGQWTLSAVATLHSGWPTTTLSLAGSDPAAPIAVAGARNGERLDALRRVDFTAARSFPLAVGSLRFLAELTNATDRENPCCVRYDITSDAGSPRLERSERPGLPLLANFGVRWEF